MRDNRELTYSEECHEILKIVASVVLILAIEDALNVSFERSICQSL